VRNAFLNYYDQLRRRLRQQLGSADLADDALHETWLRIERIGDSREVRNPAAYFYRAALNEAFDRHRGSGRLLLESEIDAVIHMEDASQDPVAITSARQDIDALRQALKKLPARQRHVLMASRLQGEPHRDIAAGLGVSTRTVEKDLKAALRFCGEEVGREVIQRFGPGAGTTS
jgi:RNA polymerase sigma-70 factor (ECF subfamily)